MLITCNAGRVICKAMGAWCERTEEKQEYVCPSQHSQNESFAGTLCIIILLWLLTLMDVFAPRDQEQGSIHAVAWNKTSVASLFVSHLNAPIDQDKLYLSAL